MKLFQINRLNFLNFFVEIKSCPIVWSVLKSRIRFRYTLFEILLMLISVLLF